MYFDNYLKILTNGQIKPNLAGIVLGWSGF